MSEIRNNIPPEAIAAINQRVVAAAKGDNREVAYHYCIEICRWLKADGFWASPDPAPLSVDELVQVFERVRDHEAYEGQTLTTHTFEGTRVWLKHGIITTREEGEGWNLPPLQDD